MAGAVIALIHDNHQIKNGLNTALMNTMTEDQCDSPTMKLVEDFLQTQLGKEKQQDIYETFKMWTACEIRTGELYTDFTTRWDTAYQTMFQKDNEMKIPKKALSMMVRGAAKLPDTAQMSIRANLKFEGDDIYKNTLKMINSICQGQTNVGAKTAQVKLCTDIGEHDIIIEHVVFLININYYCKDVESS